MDCMTQPRQVSTVANGVMADFAFIVPYIKRKKRQSFQIAAFQL